MRTSVLGSFLALSGAAAAMLAGVMLWQRAHPRFVLFGSPAQALVVELCVLAALLLGAAWAARRRRVAALLWILPVIVMALVVVGAAARARQHRSFTRRAQPELAPIIERLRFAIAEQEEHRLRSGAYASDPGAIGLVAQGDERIAFTADRDRGWRGEIASAARGYRCAVHVRDAAPIGVDSGALEGVPRCALAGGRIFQPSEGHVVPRASAVPAARPMSDSSSDWPQYRGDAAHSGRCCAGERPAYRWRTALGAPIRATPAVTGHLIIVGAHGTGEIAALDRRDGRLVWRTRAPNWIHNDPIVRNGIVVVGFGNKDPSPRFPVVGSPPSGAAAYDLKTGRRLWIVRTEGSVMTSPVIVDSTVVIAAYSNEVLGVSLRTGQQRWRTVVPTAALMGNASADDSTVYVNGDPTDLCALSAVTGKTRWCSRIPGVVWRLGESSPALADSVVVVTTRRDTAFFDVLLKGRVFDVVRDSYRLFNAGERSYQGEHLAIGLSRRTGERLWTVSLGGGYDIPGNAAGTATIADGVAYVISPIGRTITAIRAATGERLWQRPARAGVRGSLSVIDGRVLAIGQDGYVSVLSVAGEPICTAPTGIRSDRAGVTVAGVTAYIGAMDGEVVALPLEELLRCGVARR